MSQGWRILSCMSERSVSDEACVAAIQQGSDPEKFFRILFERYYSLLVSFFRKKGMPAEESRELTQDTFFSVYRGLPGFRQEASFKSWLYKIALHILQTEIERRHAQKRDALLVPLENTNEEEEALSPADTVAAPGLDPIGIALEKEQQAKLREAMQQLPVQMCRCITLRIVHDLSYAEIAAVMGLSLGTVKAHLHQAKKSLGEKLGGYFGELEV